MLVGAFGFALIPLRLDESDWWWALGVGSILLYIIACDLRTQVIPNPSVLLLSALALVRALASNSLTSSLTGGLFACVLFALMAGLLGHMGAGDVKLAAAIGVLSGWPNVMHALYWAILMAGVVVVALLVLKRIRRDDAVAYGPYLCLGEWLFWLFGAP